MGQPLPTTSDPIDEQRILAAGNEIWHIETRHDVAAASRRNAQGPDILSIRTLGARLALKKLEYVLFLRQALSEISYFTFRTAVVRLEGLGSFHKGMLQKNI
jgi:hypothetical protein